MHVSKCKCTYRARCSYGLFGHDNKNDNINDKRTLTLNIDTIVFGTYACYDSAFGLFIFKVR